jgi:transcriptional regulator with XRE-family HTH domain
MATIHRFHLELAKLRQASRWPDQEDFSCQVGLSLGGYRKYETGERIPSMAALQQIYQRAKVDPLLAEELLHLRNEAKALQAGLPTNSQTPSVDSDALAKRIRSEVVFVLKQVGIEVKDNTKGVVEKRIAMILKSALGV